MKIFTRLNLALILLMPAFVSADNWTDIEADTAMYGRIVKVKNTTSTDKCKKLADKYGAVAYSIDSKKGKCSVLKSVTLQLCFRSEHHGPMYENYPRWFHPHIRGLRKLGMKAAQLHQMTPL